MEIKRNPPVVEQLVKELSSRINSGIYSAGSRLPSESDLAKEFNVSRASVREALADLDAKDMLWRKQGIGTFVMDSRAVFRSRLPTFTTLKQYITQVGFEATMKALPAKFRPLTVEEKEVLNIAEDTEGAVLYRTYCADETPVFICEYLIPEQLFNKPRSSIDFSLDIPEFIKTCVDDQVSAIQTGVKPVAADADTAASMGIETGMLILLLNNVFFGQQGTPIILNKIFFNNYKIDFFAFYSID
jgi:GntR family transcriptional regulator